MDENILYKKCPRCKELKPLSEFIKSKQTKDKLTCYCKDCEKERVKLWVENNKEKNKETRKVYYEKNKEKIYKKNKLWHQNNKEKYREYFKEYRKTHQK